MLSLVYFRKFSFMAGHDENGNFIIGFVKQAVNVYMGLSFECWFMPVVPRRSSGVLLNAEKKVMIYTKV